MLTVATFPVPEEAYVLKGVLKEAGIEAFLKDEHLIGNAPHYMAITGGVKVQVQPEDFDQAMAILKEADLVSHSPWANAQCPTCHSQKVEITKTYLKDMSWAMLLLTALLLGIPLIMRKRSLHCIDCGAVWR